MSTNDFSTVIAISFAVSKLVEMLVTPLFDKKKWDRFWLLYVGAVLGAVCQVAASMYSKINAFPAMGPIAGVILTCACAAGGPSLLYNLQDRNENNVPKAPLK